MDTTAIMDKLTFKQYLESKDQLKKAISNTPISIIEYEAYKYCSLSIGETEDEKQSVGIRPKNKILVEWRYDNLDAPTPTAISFEGVKGIDCDEKYATFWSGTKLQKWLSRHTKEGINNGHKI